MQLKKIALVFLVVIMMFSLAAISIAAEEAGTEFSLSAKVESDSALSSDPLAVKPGDIIKYVISVDSNPGSLVTLETRVSFDTEALEFLGVKTEDIGNVFEKNEVATRTQITTKEEANANGRIQVWLMANSGYETNATGTFVTLNFKVSESFHGDIEKLDVYNAGYIVKGQTVSTYAVPATAAIKVHNYGEPSVEAGTCVSSANNVYTCTHPDCDEVLKVPTGEIGGHKCENLNAAVAPTCAVAGQVAHYVCANDGCGKYIAEDKVTVLDTVVVAINPNAHKCEEANFVPAIAPGCVTEGQKAYYVCSNEGCGKNIAEDKVTVLDSLVVPTVGHKCENLVAAVAPDCEKPGNVAYYVCGNSDCGEYIAEDKTTVLDDVVVPANGHTYGELVAKVPATTEKDGHVAHYLCSVCEKYFNEGKVEISSIVIPKLPKMISVPEDSVWVKGSDVSLTFVSNGKFEDFVKVTINGVLLEKGGYKLEKGSDGSTSVTLEPAYLEHLEPADYTIAIESANGSCEADFTVEANNSAVIVIIVVVAVLLIIGGVAAAIVVLKKKKII